MPRYPLAAILTALTLTGCITAGKMYQPPASSSLASLEVVNHSKGKAGMFIYEDATECSRRAFTGYFANNSKKLVKIVSDKNVAFTVGSYVSPNAICNITLSFKPEPNATYRAIFFSKASEQRCYIQLDKIYPDGEAIPVVFQKRQWHNGWDDNSSFCDPL